MGGRERVYFLCVIFRDQWCVDTALGNYLRVIIMMAVASEDQNIMKVINEGNERQKSDGTE